MEQQDNPYPLPEVGSVMITLGVILIIISFFVFQPVLLPIGIVLVVVGLILWALGATGRAVGGRTHYY